MSRLTSILTFLPAFWSVALSQIQPLWRQIPLPASNHSYTFLDYADSLHGLLFSSDGSYLFTTDGGETWTSDSLQTDQTVHDMKLVSPTTIWVASHFTNQYGNWRSITFHRSLDAGSNWLHVPLSDSAFTDYGYVCSFCFLDTCHVVTGTCAPYGNDVVYLLRSSDCGITWRAQQMNSFYRIRGAEFTDTLHGTLTMFQPIGVGGSSGLLTTHDGGVSWDSAGWEGDRVIGPVHYYTDSLGYLTGEEWIYGGEIRCALDGFTYNGGRTWYIGYDFGPDVTFGVLYPSRNGLVFYANSRVTRFGGDSLYVVTNSTAGDTLLAFETLSEDFALLLCSNNHLYRKTGLSTDIQHAQFPPSREESVSISVFPNPFNSLASIEYGLTEPRHIQLAVYNVLGQRVERLLDKQEEPGIHRLEWNAADLPSGIYIFEFLYGNRHLTTRVLLLR